MEHRYVKLTKRKAGGSAGASSVKYSVNIPSVWAKEMSANYDMLEISYDGAQIIIKPRAYSDSKMFLKAARDKGHLIKEYHYMDKNTLCTKIYADFTARQVCAENAAENILDTAFGVNAAPTWASLESFFESRCIPRTREGLEYYLKEVGVSRYDPFMLIEKTQGRMAEDNKWIKIV